MYYDFSERRFYMEDIRKATSFQSGTVMFDRGAEKGHGHGHGHITNLCAKVVKILTVLVSPEQRRIEGLKD
jgi:hypothetical protein